MIIAMHLTLRIVGIRSCPSIWSIHRIHILKSIDGNTFEYLLQHDMVLDRLIFEVRRYFIDVPLRNKFRSL